MILPQALGSKGRLGERSIILMRSVEQQMSSLRHSVQITRHRTHAPEQLAANGTPPQQQIYSKLMTRMVFPGMGQESM